MTNGWGRSTLPSGREIFEDKNQEKSHLSPHVDQLVDLAASVDQFLGNLSSTFVDGEMDGQVVAVKHQRVQLSPASLDKKSVLISPD